MPTIAIDARMVGHTGIGQYLTHLLSEFSAANAPDRFRLIGDPVRLGPFQQGLHAELAPCRAPIYSLQEQWAIPPRTRGAALLHVPHFNIPLRARLPLVVTIHDLIYLLIPQAARHPGVRWYARTMLQAATRRATRIIAVSERTREDLIRVLRVSPERITVIYQGVGVEFVPARQSQAVHALRRRLGWTEPIILWVSSLKPHKNPGTAIRAFARARQQHRLPHHLVMIGREDPHEPAARQLIRQHRLETVVHLIGAVNAAELPAWYNAADLLLHPSYYEGFGLPPVEAMACGTPVICSDRGALPEVVGDGARLVPPDEIDAWASAIYDTVTNVEATARQVARGRLRAARFTWTKTAQHTLAVYQEVIHDARRPRP